MNRFLRRLAEWKGRRQGAQIIVFDGGAEVEKTQAFVKGVFAGAGLVVVAFAMTGPTAVDPMLAEQIERREDLLRESNERAAQAIEVADVCLVTANRLERTLDTYEEFLGGGKE